MKKRTLQLRRVFTIKAIFRLCYLCSFFFIWGCSKPASPPDSNLTKTPVPEESTLQKTKSTADSTSRMEATGLPETLLLEGRVEWSSSLFTTLDNILPPPRLRALLVFNESETREIVAYGNLRLSRSETDSGCLKLAQGHAAERLASGLIPLDDFLLWKNRSRKETVIPVDFLYPPSDSKLLTELKGKLTLVTAGTSSVETISDLQSFIGNAPSKTNTPPGGVEVHLLTPQYEGNLSSIVVIFTSDVIISDAQMLDAKGNRLKETWAELSQLPDGRTRVVVVPESDPLTEKWQLQFKRHSELIQSEVDFVFRNLLIPKLDQVVSENQKRLVQWTPSSVNTGNPQGHHVEAKVGWSNITSIDKNGNNEPNPLKIQIDILGPKATRTVGFGHLKLETAVAAGKLLLSIKEEDPTYRGPHDGIVAYDPLELFPHAPVDGAGVVFQFQSVVDEVRSIDKLNGQCKLLTTTAQKKFVIDDIMQYLGKAIEHPLLNKHNITLVPEMFGSGLSIPVKADNVLAVQEIVAIDNSGGASRRVYCGRQQFNERMFFSIIPQGELPEVIPIRITINEGLEEMTVPFAFKNLPIPAKPKSEPTN